MSRNPSFSMVIWILAIGFVLFFVFRVLPDLHAPTPSHDSGLPDYSEYFPLESVDTADTVDYFPISEEEWTQWTNGLIHFKIDVTVPTSHSWLKHGVEDAKNALRCVTENGVSTVIGEHSNRTLHLLCQDAEGNQYVVVINELKRSTDPYKNTHSFLNTAFRLKQEYGETIEDYVRRMTKTEPRRGNVLRMRFDPQDIYFMPY